MKIAVIGTGYVGLVTGGCLAEMGNLVTCIDQSVEKVHLLNDGIPPFYEPGLAELVRSNLLAERLYFTTDLKKAIQENDILFVAVGTPTLNDGSVDLTDVMGVCDEISQTMCDTKYVVIKSTVPTGTCDLLNEKTKKVLKSRNLNAEIFYISNPEFLKEGSAILDFMKPDRIVIGTDSVEAKIKLQELYHPFVLNGHRIINMDTRSAELCKYAANAMLATKISLMNELATLSEKVGADIGAIRQGIGSDPRIGPHFIYAGLGYGGSCFPKDVQALIHCGNENQLEMKILESVKQVNASQRTLFLQKITDYFGADLRGKKFAIWGLSFKPETDDIREAPSLDVIRGLLDLGAEVRGYDPAAGHLVSGLFAQNSRYQTLNSQYDVLESADALILCTEWKPFRSPDFQKIKQLLKNPLLFDGRNQFEPKQLIDLGIQYISVGRPSTLNPKTDPFVPNRSRGHSPNADLH